MVRRGFEAVQVGDFATIAVLLDSDVKWHGGDPSAPGSCQNRSQALESMRRRAGMVVWAISSMSSARETRLS